MNNIPMSKDSFTAFLHHSYPDFFTNIKDFSMAAESFSISDPYFHEWSVSESNAFCENIFVSNFDIFSIMEKYLWTNTEDSSRPED